MTSSVQAKRENNGQVGGQDGGETDQGRVVVGFRGHESRALNFADTVLGFDSTEKEPAGRSCGRAERSDCTWRRVGPDL